VYQCTSQGRIFLEQTAYTIFLSANNRRSYSLFRFFPNQHNAAKNGLDTALRNAHQHRIFKAIICGVYRRLGR
jgi:hypothetical protein